MLKWRSVRLLRRLERAAKQPPLREAIGACFTRASDIADERSVGSEQTMEGSLLQRGVGWYLQFQETIEQVENVDGPFWTGNVNPGHVVGFSLGAIYVASPVDFIPDFIPIIGYVDDVMVLNGATTIGGWMWDMFD